MILEKADDNFHFEGVTLTTHDLPKSSPIPNINTSALSLLSETNITEVLNEPSSSGSNQNSNQNMNPTLPSIPTSLLDQIPPTPLSADPISNHTAFDDIGQTETFP